MTASYEATVVAVTPNSSGAPTFTELGTIPPTDGLLYRAELAGSGMATVSGPCAHIDPVVQARLRDLTQTPAELWVRRTDQSTLATTLVHAGPITGCAIKDRVLTVTASGLPTYLGYMCRDTDYTGTGFDLATIVANLVDQYQAQTYGHYGLLTSALTATGVTVTPYQIVGREGRYIDKLIPELGSRTAGFDLAIDPTTRAIKLWAPRKGSDLTNSVILDARSIRSSNISWSVAPGQVGSEVFATASSAAGPALQSEQSNTTLRASMGRRFMSRTFQNIADQSALDDAATRALTDATSQPFTISPELLPVAGFSYGDFTTGDQILYNYDAGLGTQTFTVRVATVEVNVSNGAEVLRVGML